MRHKWLWGILATAAGLIYVDYLGRRWGATDDEVLKSLAGDDVLPSPMLETTHAVTINTRADDIWPWLVQMGYGRAGWYYDSRFNKFMDDYFWPTIVPEDARGKFIPSAERILPEHQHTQVGDVVPDGPPGSAYFLVHAMQLNHYLVLHSSTHIKYATPSFLHSSKWASDGEFTWVYVLNALTPTATRLVLRMRANIYPRWIGVLGRPLIMLVDFLHAREQLNNIKDRVEGSL